MPYVDGRSRTIQYLVIHSALFTREFIERFRGIDELIERDLSEKNPTNECRTWNDLS